MANDLDMITDILAPYEESQMDQFESNISECEKNATAGIETQQFFYV